MKASVRLCYLIIISIVVSLLTPSCKDGKDKPTPAPPVKVKILVVSPDSLVTGRSYSGTVASAETTDVSFSVAGTITELYAKEGQKVIKGQLLGKVRNGEYQNAYNIAQAQLAEAQDGYNRLKKLHDANALPEVKWVEIQQKLKQAENMAEMAERTLNDASLHCPVSGTVTRKFCDLGQNVMPVEPVYEIISTDRLTVDVSISENEIGGFNKGDSAIVSIKSAGITELMGSISQKTVVADPLTRSFTVKVDIPSCGGKILPGMIGEVAFERNKRNSSSMAHGIVLPSQAVLLSEDNRLFVWLANDSVAERRFVTADVLVAEGVLVKTGLNPGDKVIVEGVRKIGTGTKLEY